MTDGLTPARYDVMQIEALYRIACGRRLSNSETDDLATISRRVAERAEREAMVRVPEFMLAPVGW